MHAFFMDALPILNQHSYQHQLHSHQWVIHPPFVVTEIEKLNHRRHRHKQPIHVAASKQRGKNPFPKDWRMHAFFMDALPICYGFS
jgi:hypothetical protein